MSWRIAWGLVVASVAVCSPLGSSLAEEIDKKPIIEQWRKEIQPLKEAYGNCQIEGSLMSETDPDRDGLEFHSGFTYVRRGALQRLDILIANPKMPLNESWIIGKKEAYRIFRANEDLPFKLHQRSFEKNVKDYEKVQNFTPYTKLRYDLVAGAPTFVLGMDGPDFIAQDIVKLHSDERPDAQHPRSRKFSGTWQPLADKPAQDIWIVVDEGRHWAVIETSQGRTESRRTNKFHYADDGADIPKLLRIETYVDKKEGFSGLAGEHRIESLTFNAPKEEVFTLAAFDIPEDAESERDKPQK